MVSKMNLINKDTFQHLIQFLPIDLVSKLSRTCKRFYIFTKKLRYFDILRSQIVIEIPLNFCRIHRRYECCISECLNCLLKNVNVFECLICDLQICTFCLCICKTCRRKICKYCFEDGACIKEKLL